MGGRENKWNNNYYKFRIKVIWFWGRGVPWKLLKTVKKSTEAASPQHGSKDKTQPSLSRWTLIPTSPAVECRWTITGREKATTTGVPASRCIYCNGGQQHNSVPQYLRDLQWNAGGLSQDERKLLLLGSQQVDVFTVMEANNTIQYLNTYESCSGMLVDYHRTRESNYWGPSK